MKKYICFTLFMVCFNFSFAQTKCKSVREELKVCANVNEELRYEIAALKERINKLKERNSAQADKIKRLSEVDRGGSNNKVKNQHQSSTQQGNHYNIDLNEKKNIVKLREEFRDKLESSPSTIAKTIAMEGGLFDTYIINLENQDHKLKFYWKDKNGIKYSSLGRVNETDSKNELLFATNGGMFNPSQVPQGLLIQDSKISKGLDSSISGYGNFYLKPNGVFLITKEGKARVVTTQQFRDQALLGKTLNATQSGPMLLINGAYHPEFNQNSPNRRIRSGVGIINEHTIVFAISKGEVTFYDFAKLFKEVFACDNALFLDGSISKMYCPELERFDSDGNFGTIIGLTK